MNFEPFTFVLERLGQFLIDEIDFLSKDKEKLLRALKQQLELAQSFVRDVEEEKQQVTISHVLETEVQHLMEILPQIEDFLDAPYIEVAQPSQQQTSCFPKFMPCFSSTSTSTSIPLVRRHLVIDRAVKLTDDLLAIRKRAEPYQRQSNRPQLTQRRRPQTQSYIIDEEFIVGLEEDVKTLIAKLVGNDGEHTTILAIAGMGGSGKTTLARKLYNHKEVSRHFSSRAWVCVSQEWDTPQLLRSICESFRIRLPEDKSTVPYFKLREFLLRNSCLVVLDDVWEMKALQELLPLLLQQVSSKESGRVLVTTRNEKILNYPTLSGVYIHEASPLTSKESWDLFSKIVRNKWHGIRSFDDESEFAKLGKEMLERCFGLPLAIVALAGLLSTKGTIQEWETLKKNIMSMILRQNQGFHDYGAVREMLELSYSDLPYDLKPCFLYLGIFSEDSTIYLDDLAQLWIGEGILKTNMCSENQTLEEIAMDFVDQLAQRRMVQVNIEDFGVVKIRVHDLLRDLCIKKARELRFFDISSPPTSHSTTAMEPMSHRVIFHNRESYLIRNPRLRSIIHFRNRPYTEIKLDLTYENMKLLRVLHLEYVDLRDLEDQIGKSILLRYLRLQSCGGVTNKLFDSIKKLRNLQTLIYDGRAVIPNNMVDNMEHLRHLDLMEGTEIEGPMLGVKRSRSLQYLSSPAGEWLTKEMNVSNMIDSLRVLRLEDIDSQAQLEEVYVFVSNPSNHLHTLHLHLEEGSGLEFDLQMMKLKSHRLLKTLRLWGQIRKQPESLLFPSNLLVLDLYGNKIEKEDDLERALNQLHQLRYLTLCIDSYVGDRLTMSGLPQLQKLGIWDVRDLKEWRIEEGALTQLKELDIDGCLKLERIPEGIRGIKTLQYFRANTMSNSFYERLRPPPEKEDCGGGLPEGEHFHLIRHIPNIILPSYFYNYSCGNR